MDKKDDMKFSEITEEVSRCLLCYDPPCSSACPGKKNAADIIMSLRLKNYKGACHKFMNDLDKSGECGAVCNNKMYCQRNCIRGKIDRPIKIRMIHKFLREKSLKVGGGNLK